MEPAGVGNGSPLQYSCLENSMDRAAWWAIVHGAAESQTKESHHAPACARTHTHTHTHPHTHPQRHTHPLSSLGEINYCVWNYAGPAVFILVGYTMPACMRSTGREVY